MNGDPTVDRVAHDQQDFSDGDQNRVTSLEDPTLTLGEIATHVASLSTLESISSEMLEMLQSCVRNGADVLSTPPGVELPVLHLFTKLGWFHGVQACLHTPRPLFFDLRYHYYSDREEEALASSMPAVAPLHFALCHYMYKDNDQAEDGEGVDEAATGGQDVEEEVEVDTLPDGSSGATPSHRRPCTAVQLFSLLTERFSRHPCDTIYWGKRWRARKCRDPSHDQGEDAEDEEEEAPDGWERHSFLALAAYYQRLSLFWPLVKHFPFFDDELEPISLSSWTVWEWDYKALGPTEQVFFEPLSTASVIVRANRATAQLARLCEAPKRILCHEKVLQLCTQGVRHSPDPLEQDQGGTRDASSTSPRLEKRPPEAHHDTMNDGVADVNFHPPDMEAINILHHFLHRGDAVECFQACLQTPNAIDFTAFTSSYYRTMFFDLCENRIKEPSAAAMLRSIVDRIEHRRAWVTATATATDQMDQVDFTWKDRFGHDFLSYAAYLGRLSWIWPIIKPVYIALHFHSSTGERDRSGNGREPPEAVDDELVVAKACSSETITLTRPVREHDFTQLSLEDQAFFECSAGFYSG